MCIDYSIIHIAQDILQYTTTKTRHEHTSCASTRHPGGTWYLVSYIAPNLVGDPLQTHSWTRMMVQSAESCPYIPRDKETREELWALGMRMISRRESYIRKCIGFGIGSIFVLLMCFFAWKGRLLVPLDLASWQYHAHVFIMCIIAGASVTLYEMGEMSQ